MPLPTTRVVTGHYVNPATGANATGRVVLTPYPGVWTDETGDQVLTGGATITLIAGAFSATLVTTDAAGVEPVTGRLWVLEERIDGRPYRRRAFALDAGVGSVDITDLVVADPALPGYVRGATGAPGAAGATGATGPQGPAGPAGSGIRTAQARITDGAIVDLPSAPSWTIALTSVGTPLQCAITAAAGDRIRVHLSMLYSGSRFMDLALLDSAGAIAQYGASGTGTPLAEGAPEFYPSTSFSTASSAGMFTVGAGHINGSGQAVVALAQQGVAAGKVYANGTYPWRMLLENLGASP